MSSAVLQSQMLRRDLEGGRAARQEQQKKAGDKMPKKEASSGAGGERRRMLLNKANTVLIGISERGTRRLKVMLLKVT